MVTPCNSGDRGQWCNENTVMIQLTNTMYQTVSLLTVDILDHESLMKHCNRTSWVQRKISSVPYHWSNTYIHTWYGYWINIGEDDEDHWGVSMSQEQHWQYSYIVDGCRKPFVFVYVRPWKRFQTLSCTLGHPINIIFTKPCWIGASEGDW